MSKSSLSKEKELQRRQMHSSNEEQETNVFWSISSEQMVLLSFWMGRGVKKGRLGPTFH